MEGENERGRSWRGRMRMACRVEGLEAQVAESEGENQRGPSRRGR